MYNNGAVPSTVSECGRRPTTNHIAATCLVTEFGGRFQSVCEATTTLAKWNEMRCESDINFCRPFYVVESWVCVCFIEVKWEKSCMYMSVQYRAIHVRPGYRAEQQKNPQRWVGRSIQVRAINSQVKVRLKAMSYLYMNLQGWSWSQLLDSQPAGDIIHKPGIGPLLLFFTLMVAFPAIEHHCLQTCTTTKLYCLVTEATAAGVNNLSKGYCTAVPGVRYCSTKLSSSVPVIILFGI